MPPAPDRLSRREREIMHALFALGERASVEDIRAELSDPPSYSAVRAMLAKLEAKGYLTHRAERFRYLYAPTTPRVTARRTALQELVRVFFAGSPADTAKALLSNENWTDADLAALAAEVDRIRNERQRTP